MGEAVVSLFILIAVLGVSILLVGSWVMVATVKGVGKMLGMEEKGPEELVCGKCRQINPAAAHFCRRCGTPI